MQLCYHSETCYIYVNAFAHVKRERGREGWRGKWRKFIYNALPQVLKPTTLCNTPHPSTHPSSCYTSLLTDSHFDTHAPISGFHRPEKLLDLAIQLLSPARLHRIAFEIHALYIFIVFFPPSVLLYFLRVCP